MANQQEPSTEFSLIIVSPDEVVLETTATRLMAPGVYQEIAILPDHTPLYAELKKGEVKITQSDSKEEKVPIESGIMRVKQNKVSIILGFKE